MNEKETEEYTNKLEQERMSLLAEIIYLREKRKKQCVNIVKISV